MANEYYNASGFPVNSQDGRSVDMRAELLAITAAFNKLPGLAGNQNKTVVVDPAGTGLTVTGSTIVPTVDWTPVVSCATPGNLTVAYTTQIGSRVSVSGMTVLSFEIVTSTWTHTTASGVVILSGMPNGPSDFSPAPITTLLFSGMTKAGYTQVAFRYSGSGQMLLQASGTGVAIADVNVTDFPTGGTVVLKGTVVYGSN